MNPQELPEIDESMKTATLKSASGNTVVEAGVNGRGAVVITVMRDGHLVERFDLKYETNMGAGKVIKADKENLYIFDLPIRNHVAPDVVPIR